LDLGGVITEGLDAWMLPAVGQGALGLECRADDTVTRAAVAPLNHGPSWWAVLAERAFLRGLGGGCLLPIAALARVVGDGLTLRGAVFDPTGARIVEGDLAGTADQAEEWGMQLAERLLGQGAEELLKTIPPPAASELQG
jgi:hydroxymethylbilane synthase